MTTLFNIHSPLDQFEITSSLTLDAPILGNFSLLFKGIQLSESIVTVTITTTFNADNVLSNIINNLCNYISTPALFNNNIVLLYQPCLEFRGIPLPSYSHLASTVLPNAIQSGAINQLSYDAMLAFQIFYKIWNSPLLVGVLGYLFHLLYILIRNKVFLFLHILSIFIVRADALLIKRESFSNVNVNLILMTLGNFFFMIFNLIFDYISVKINLRNKIYINKLCSRILCSLVYFLNITSGVFATNGTYFYLRDTRFNNVGLGLSVLFSLLFSYFWFTLSIPTNLESRDGLNSIFRSITECIGFNSVAWLTYVIWEFWANTVNNYYYWGLLFLIPFVAFSVITILLEIRGFIAVMPWTLMYPIFYVLMFSAGAFFTNSLFYIYLYLNAKMYTTFILLGISSITTAILYPDVYRSRNTSGGLWIKSFLYTMHYLLLFISFVFVSGILYNFI